MKHPRVLVLLQADYDEWEKSGFAPVKLITDAVTDVPPQSVPALAAVPDVNGVADRTPTLDDTPKSKADLRVVPELLAEAPATPEVTA